MNVNKITTDNLKKIAKPLSNFKNPDKVLPILLVETMVTSGRTYQAYKRGGKTEARERFVEQSVAGVVWLFGVATLNKIGDFIGKRFLGLTNLGVDVGKDELRQPFDANFKNIAEKNRTAMFKFGKIFGSVVLATAFIGFVMPKLTQAITNKFAKSDKEKTQNEPHKHDEFKKAHPEESQKEELNSKKEAKISFGSGANFANTLLSATNMLENNAICRLLSTDVGITTGRCANARNKYEARELGVRDVASIYFYMFAPKHLQMLFNKISGNTDIHPQTLISTVEELNKQMGDKTFTPEIFKKHIISDGVKAIPEGLFKDAKSVVTLDDFIESLGDKATDAIRAKAKAMTELQPKRDGVGILTKMQAEDILSSTWTSNPKFLKDAINKGSNGKANDVKKFISRKSLENIRTSIDDFTKYVSDYAEKTGKEINANLVNKLAKRNLVLNCVFTAASMLGAAYVLAMVIPKAVRMMTKITTGKDEFPGTAEYKNDKKETKDTEKTA